MRPQPHKPSLQFKSTRKVNDCGGSLNIIGGTLAFTPSSTLKIEKKYRLLEGQRRERKKKGK